MRNMYILIHVLALISIFHTVMESEAYAPGYRTVKITKRKIPIRPVQTRYKGELLSDGSVNWYKIGRTAGGGWSKWRPVSVHEVPPNLLKQMAIRASNFRKHSGLQRGIGTGIPGAGIDYSPDGHEYIRTVDSAGYKKAGYDYQHELPSPTFQRGSGIAAGKDYSWVELSGSDTEPPLSIEPLGQTADTKARAYNYQAEQIPEIQRQRVSVFGGQLPVALSDRETITAPVKLRLQKQVSHEGDDMARYFESKQAPQMPSIPSALTPGGVMTKLARGLKSMAPHEIPTPSIELPYKKAGEGIIPRVSEYDLTRMQWGFFVKQYNQRLDNVRVIRRVPPLGIKLSKTVSECSRNIFNSFKLNYVSVSGITYSKKLKRGTILSVVREIKQWCNGMMTNWYHQLQLMGYRVPTAKEFMR